ncbi:heterokaryon incompatibility protein Het-C-domain-containing protein [Calycina marina]|uniref:Heterokaryon incompatibility protein Het-C-domain-containing protein n=1 Tax=Calycina marina TaxID=1763456 RepID=A0A9P7Z5J4_9HELO|nr:heterokaryon incompatibility protein Het-C-domain-containing protein [Calycina marina]
MGLRAPSIGTSLLLAACVVLLVLPAPAAAFGAGNIPSISTVEGQNFRHGDIEDMLKTIAFIKGHKWTSMMVKRVYFGNWLRDYSQAVDVGSLKGVNAPTIRILVWVLSFLSFGYATAEFEVTEERLGVYRPEEHIDNPKDYADNSDARKFDPRLRGPVAPAELEVDQNTGMKNYIANESGGWATSAGYVKFSLARSIHFGRLYTNGSGKARGREEDLCEALRCLGQGLHCLEDFGAHTNYVELALRELGYRDVFPHTGISTEITVRGHRLYPLVTGTFGAVDFLHSVLGEATDHFTQTEVEEMDLALLGAENKQASGGGDGSRGLFGGDGNDFASLLGQIPGIGGGFAKTARELQNSSAQQEYQNSNTRAAPQFDGPPRASGQASIPGMSPDFDPIKTAKQIYPILEFRDNIVKAISATIAKIPGLEALVEKIGETLTIFVLSLLAPFVRPIINAVSKSLKEGSTGVVEASANSQFEPWNDPHCTNPTHSMLSKDHFSNKLNGPAGCVATTILQYVTPRVLYAWENPGISVEEVMNDILRVFHHPTLRDEHLEIHSNMFNTVRKWVDKQPDRNSLNHILSSASVKAGRNHAGEGTKGVHDHGALGGHGKTAGSIWTEIKTRDIGAMEGYDTKPHSSYMQSPQPGSPAFPGHHQDYGYENRPGSADRLGSSGVHLNPKYGDQQGRSSFSPYQTQDNSSFGQEPSSFGMPPGPSGFQQAPPPPYSNQKPWQGGQQNYNQYPPGPHGYNQYPQQQGPPGHYQGGHQGPPGGFQGGPSGNYGQGHPGGWQHGPPPGNWQGPPQGQPGYPGGSQPQYPGEYPSQQPPYGGGGGGHRY